MALHISKSKYLSGLQCPKLLWTQLNERELIPEPGPAQQYIFDTGHMIGELAKQIFPTGVEVPMNFKDLSITDSDTAELMNRPSAERVPIFEASFLIDNRYCRVDVLVPVDNEEGEEANRWDLVEVKSSTRVKDVNVQDVAFQSETLTRSGVHLRRLYLMHINTGYVLDETFDVQKFFHLEDITTRVETLLSYVPRTVGKMLDVVRGPDPDTPIGPRCTKPYTCPLIPHCWAGLPDNNVTELYYGGRRAFGLLDEGLFSIETVPDDRLSHQQRIQKQTIISGEAHHDAAHLRTWLDELVYPVYHLDFETMNPAKPPFRGTRPYQRLPFQYSLHIQAAPDAEPRHLEFLAQDKGDPRPAMVEALRELGTAGTVLTWNMGFEKGVLDDLAELYPPEAEWLSAITERMVDLMVPFRSFWYHHPAQKGRCSLKAVLPAVTTLSYGELAIADGNHAARAYEEVIYGDVEAGRRAEVMGQLLEYCKLDTLAMVEILRVLNRAAS